MKKNIDKQVYVKYNCNIKTRGSDIMKMLYIDFDGVILDTIPVLYETAQKEGYEISDAEFYKNFNYKEILKNKYIIKMSHRYTSLLGHFYYNFLKWLLSDFLL